MTDRFGGICECGDHAWAVLTKGFVARVSPGDADLLRANWKAHQNATHPAPYAARTTPSGPQAKKLVYLHRRIMLAPPGIVVDHINCDPLDNRRENLRLCSLSNNLGNRRVNRGKKGSPFKGVKRTKWGWEAFLRGKYLGKFDCERDAAEAYDRAASTHYGEFARTNASMGLL